MYFILVNDPFCDFDFYIKAPTDLPRAISFISGRQIDGDCLKLPLEFITDASANDTIVDFRDGTIPLMSEKCLSLFRDAGVDNLQTFPAIVRSDVDGTIWKNYYAINVLGLISCADLDKSEFTEIMPGSYRFRESAIDANKAKEALLFRLQEDSGSILMHKSIGKYIVENDPEEELLGWEADDIIQ